MLPRGHFAELVLRLGDTELWAFAPEPPAGVAARVRVSAARALCYLDDQLCEPAPIAEVAS
ncbi:MAG TPA: hypothetical protein VH008_24285 [Pseudonocardia sp.]|nr:hypothetical protein [Pseudonocardia sp.]